MQSIASCKPSFVVGVSITTIVCVSSATDDGIAGTATEK